VEAGLKGAAQGGATAASLSFLGALNTLEYYGYYQTVQGVRDFNEQVLSNNSTNYTEQQQRASGEWFGRLRALVEAIAGVAVMVHRERYTQTLFLPMPILLVAPYACKKTYLHR
jgi:hypothetical protein